jgi:DNA-binding response OmpR family regulator
LTHKGRILVVVPDHGLRGSLKFALEVEGYAVLSAEDLTVAGIASFGEGNLCVIVDEDAILDRQATLRALRELQNPIIMLVDRLRPDLPNVHVLRKPWFGNALVKMIISAVQDNDAEHRATYKPVGT